MLKIKRGFTLIEVIVSIALLGILAVAFLPSITNHFKWLVDTKTIITQKSFGIQDDMEISIQNVIKAMNSGGIDPADYASLGITEKIEVELFQDEFSSYTSRYYPSAYKVEVSDGGKKFTTLVGDKRLPELPVPQIDAISRMFIKDSAESPGNHEYFNYPNLKIKAKSNMSENPSNSFNRYRSDWYVSKPGFNIPIQSIENIDEDNDIGRIYPAFPDDYVAVPIYSELGNDYSYISATERNISVELKNDIVNTHPGRHILYTITPFAKSLKKGGTSSLLPLYVYGPTVTANLALHLDASTIDMGDKYNASTNPKGTIQLDGGDNYIRTWKNSSPSLKSPVTDRNAIQTSIGNMPLLLRNDDLDDPYTGHAIPFQEGETSSRVWSRALGNKDNTIASMNSSNLSIGNNWSAFIVMRRVDTPLPPSIGSIIEGNGTNSWSIGWVGDSAAPHLGFTQATVSSQLFDPFNLGEWYLVRITANSPNLTIEANSLKKGSNHNLSETGTMSNISSNNITIRWNGIEIAEILLYNANMSSNLDEIKVYLTNKYNPD
ncbi:MAG TPA: type II secretion system protein [Clostridia bacterium]|nr:type II secretion system protein [Clostridia bacterium]